MADRIHCSIRWFLLRAVAAWVILSSAACREVDPSDGQDSESVRPTDSDSQDTASTTETGDEPSSDSASDSMPEETDNTLPVDWNQCVVNGSIREEWCDWDCRHALTPEDCGAADDHWDTVDGDDVEPACIWTPFVDVTVDTDGQCTFGAETGLCTYRVDTGESMPQPAGIQCGPTRHDNLAAMYIEDADSVRLTVTHQETLRTGSISICLPDDTDQPAFCACPCQDDFPLMEL